jgi:hypothetical protein|tara:strand:- start:525 stop:734 length:210 start_codon:yes stop_codon:yes gene_type:complete
MKTAFTDDIKEMERVRDAATSEPLRVALGWHLADLKKFERYTQLIKVIYPELHRNALLYCGYINTDDEE